MPGRLTDMHITTPGRLGSGPAPGPQIWWIAA
jgi:hypothetical protein